jgi:RNase P/RNase MRP subunit p29
LPGIHLPEAKNRLPLKHDDDQIACESGVISKDLASFTLRLKDGSEICIKQYLLIKSI